MPVRVDPDQRRRRIVAAALRLVVDQGLQAATFRKVAAEAGLNVGSVRHYFADHESLVVAVAAEAGERMGTRLARHRPPSVADEDAVGQRYLQALLEELVPLDDERRCEAIILMEIIVASRTNPAFEDVTAQMADDLHDVLVDALVALGVRDAQLEARRLAALLSGLSLDAVTVHGGLTPGMISAILRQHLTTLPGSTGT